MEKTAKEKAKELIDKYSNIEIQIGGKYDGYISMDLCDAKECALIAVDEILDILNQLSLEYEYWQEVKQEIYKL